MALDMVGEGRFHPEAHYRRFVDRDGKLCVICAQDFDYHDYDTSRFLDKRVFASEEGARHTPIDPTEMIIEASDREVRRRPCTTSAP